MLATERRAEIIEYYRQRIAGGSRIKLYSDEFETLIADCIQRIANATSLMELEMICKQEIDLLEEGYPQRTLAGDYIPRYRKAIELAIANETIELKPPFIHQYTHQQRVTGIFEKRSEHWALTFFKYDLATYEALDQRQKIEQKIELLENQGVQPQTYLQELELLLKDKGKFKVRAWAIACCALTGRSFAELLAKGTFKATEHTYLLRFEAAPKKDGVAWELLTLVPAGDVLTAINRLRRNPEVRALMRYEGAERPKAINLFNIQLNRIVNQSLGPLVPIQPNRKSISIKDLRELWASVAVWQFAPQQQRQLFVEQYLVPVVGIKVKEQGLVYDLIDEEGSVIKDEGCLSGTVRPLPIEEIPEELVVEPIDDSPIQDPQTEPTEQSRGEMSQVLGQAMENLRTDFVNQLLGLREELKAYIDGQVAEVRPPQTAQEKGKGTAAKGDKNTDWLVNRVGELEQQNHTLGQEVGALREQVVQGSEFGRLNEQLQQDNERLSAQLREAQAKLNRFKALLLGDTEEKPDVPEETPEESNGTGEEKPAIAARNSRQGRVYAKAADRAHIVFDALRAWNQKHPDATIALNASLLENGFGIHRGAAKTFLTGFADEIADHHTEIGVTVIRTHNRGKDLEGFKTFAGKWEGL